VPAGFELEEKTATLINEAWSALFYETTQKPDSDLAQALEFLFEQTGSLFSTRDILTIFLQHRSDWWAFIQSNNSGPNNSELIKNEPIKKATEQLAQTLRYDPNEHPYDDFFTAKQQDDLHEIARLFAKDPNKTGKNHADILAEALQLLPDTKKAFDKASSAFLTGSGSVKKRSGGEKLDSDKPRFDQLHNSLLDKISNTHESLNKAFNYKLSAAWYLAGHALLEYYQQIKLERRVLDFPDLEWKVYCLLSQAHYPQWVQYKLDQRIDHFLFDEFQDTNPTQWQMIRPLLEEFADAADPRQRSIFLVGDEKQSIYGFRRADWRLQGAATQWLTDAVAAQHFTLDESRRSAPAIINFVNHLFSEDSLPGFQTHSTVHKNQWGYVEIFPPIAADEMVVDDIAADDHQQTMRNPLQQPRHIKRDTRFYREGQQIAEKIEQLINRKTSILDGEEYRAINYADILILVRARKHVGDYEKACREAGIPILGMERSAFLQRLEISDLECLLRVLISPENNLALAQVLRSPIFAASNEDLMLLAQQKDGPWFQRLLKVSETLDSHSALSRAAFWLSEWKKSVGRIPVHDLLDKIYAQSNLLARYRASTPPLLQLRVQANLNQFMALALEIDSGRYPSLAKFLNTLETLRGSDDAPDEQGGHTGQAVRLMTIHQSKGLESPVVFLADTTQGRSKAKGYTPLINWPPEDKKPDYFYLCGKKSQRDRHSERFLEAQQQREQQEDRHLMYVAVTRARQILIVTSTEAKKDEENGWYATLCKAMPDIEDTEEAEATKEKAFTSLMYVTGEPVKIMAKKPPPEKHSYNIPEALLKTWSLSPSITTLAPSQLTPHSTATSIDADGQLRGIVIHRCLQLLTDPTDVPADQLIKQLATEQNISAADARLETWLNEAQALVKTEKLQHLFNSDHYTHAYNEMPLSYAQDDTHIQGFIDRLIIKDDLVSIIDYKTHQVTEAETLQSLTAHYRPQMAYYQTGIEKLWPGKKVRSYLLFTHAQELILTSG
ncbi:MAG: UvrD-helicase domain-containing protein, partial [Gammaproteobacteria bacterium]|nr:UvrD-helicase domain-containing protein [Gammaproteobacteria bacterium]